MTLKRNKDVKNPNRKKMVVSNMKFAVYEDNKKVIDELIKAKNKKNEDDSKG
ncbi:hypothetical protein [Evansella cellulosilytica]|uniref:Hydantoinase/oxoprolinase n=1 Tax=Evansella cellulosilytica (strain ATCC 21833 / DSM 2522 / FERM P-1141 / JCM 9156 / N-4) TaxID=649639 RepID=E6TS05_EVAC2|nr:hypothetical protein [Evansella cellulosilytica]ADU30659.1 hydantoinase/oxoprolinase [Evansella cellulosilytica DSM 2522]